MPTKEQVIERLETIMDPEIHTDIWTLGLIYDIVIKGERVHITMTYTTPMCPAGPMIQDEIRNELLSLGFSGVDIEVTFDPPWQPSSALRIMMGV